MQNGCNLIEELCMKLGVTKADAWDSIVHHGTGRPLPRISYRMSLEKHVCRCALVIISLEELQEKLVLLESSVEGKRLQVNEGKAKILLSGPGLNVLPKICKDSCAVCLSGVAYAHSLWEMF